MDLEKKPIGDVEELANLILGKKLILAKDLIKTFNREEHQLPLFYWRGGRTSENVKHNDENDETLLHLTAKCQDEELTSAMLHMCPDLLLVKRSARNYLGQTALHMSITKGNARVCDAILAIASRKSVTLRTLLNIRATGKLFSNTVMMGELPLFVAALTFREETVELLLQYGAPLFARNNQGDTVFHVLIKFSFLNREKMADVVKMMAFLHEKIERIKFISKQDGTQKKGNFKHIWFVRNNKKETPLQLAARYGLVEIFEFILNLKNVYCFHNANDGLFDEKSYDVTEIDTITNQKLQLEHYSFKVNKDVTTERKSSFGTTKKAFMRMPDYNGVNIESVLDMMFDRDQKAIDIVEIIEIAPVRGLIELKWQLYRRWYISWAIFHAIFIIFLSAYAIVFSETEYNSHIQPSQSRNIFVNVSKYFVFVFGLVYLLTGLAVILPRFWKPNVMRYWRHNLEHAVVIITFALSLIVEALMNIASFHHHGIPMVIALLTGWWFNIFFLRGWKLFGFFTVLLKKVIFGDFLRFALVIAFQLFSFSATLHMQFQGIGIPDIEGNEYNRTLAPKYDKALFTLFNLMLGLGGIDSLQYARNSLFAKLLYVVFVLTTYVLLLNALIAMMSRTCSALLEYRYSHWRIQQLSVILFIEDLLTVFLDKINPVNRYRRVYIKTVTMYDPTTNKNLTCDRYYIDMKTLQDDFFGDEVEEELVVKEKREQAAVNNKLNKRLITMMAVSKSLLPFLVKPKQPHPEDSTNAQPPPSVSSEDTENAESTKYVKFFEYCENDFQDGDDVKDDVDEESSPDVVLPQRFNRLRRGTITMFDKNSFNYF